MIGIRNIKAKTTVIYNLRVDGEALNWDKEQEWEETLER